MRHHRSLAIATPLAVALALLVALSGTVAAAGRPLVGHLEGGAGMDPDGRGLAVLKVRAQDGANDQLCWFVLTRKIELAGAMAKLHGPAIPSLDLSAPKSVVYAGAKGRGVGIARGCTTIADAAATALTANPGDYSVIVHNTAFAGGAIAATLR